MFEYLAPFSRIIVTGPQRSGTTICAAMIAHDLGYKFYTEDRIHTRSVWLANELLWHDTNFVLQAPAICRWVHYVAFATEVAVVLMRRKLDDIHASEHRIRWAGSYHNKVELMAYGLKEGDSAAVKYAYWDQKQKAMILNPFEVEYESLAAHPMWVPKEERVNFRSRQYQRVP